MMASSPPPSDEQSPSQPLLLPASNRLSRSYSAVSGVPQRSSEHSDEEPAWFAVLRWARLLGYGVCLIGAAACFYDTFTTLPYLALPGRARKVALSLSEGSILVMFGISVLIGPTNHVKHLFAAKRRLFTLVYSASLGLAIYCALGVRHAGALFFSYIQVLTLVHYVVTDFPTSGVRDIEPRREHHDNAP
ncbi:ER-to-golgi vesicle protein transport Sft2 [Mycena pura]|uniref:Protein transport protein SFT2 n=1 Tax=Mycena pura TaxID=153505 RepID=A0AAD6V9T5_9AGAR|nr:ER-to-golgi vesicle protein transport Sft2 [Mycena pura]